MMDVMFMLLLLNYQCYFTRVSTTNQWRCTTHELFVNESERATIDGDNIKCQSEDVSDVKFSIRNPPKHGFIIIDKEFQDPLHRNEKHFGLQDVLNGKVFYYHNGNEDIRDEITLDASFSTNQFKLNIPVHIYPSNDAPIIHVFKNIQMSSKLKLTTEILTSEDADDPPQDLIYSFNFDHFVTSSSIWIGKQTLDYDDTSSNLYEFNDIKRVDTFSHQELINGEIFVVHSGPPIQNLEMQVNDGKTSSSTKSITVEAYYPLKITKVNRMALKAVKGVWNRLTEKNLIYSVTSDHKSLDIIYHLVDAPKHGRIQIEVKKNNWINIGTDTKYWKQKDISEGKVRYMNFGENNKSTLEDEFKFQVSCLDVELAEEVFRIEIIEPMVIVDRNTGIDLIIDRESIITDSYLLFSTNGEHSNESIFYKLMATPFYGDLKFSPKEFKISENISRKRNVHHSLGFESNFTQLDLNQKKITYRLREIPLHAIVDNFQFVVFVPGFQSGIQKFQINYFPAYPPKIDERLKTNNVNYFRLYNNGLFGAFEGLSKIISTKDLNVEPFGTTDFGSYDFAFKITKETKHGWIMQSSKKVLSFTLNDVKRNLISYDHDDSENDYDYFDFVIDAMEINNSSRIIDNVTDWITETSGTFEIFIILRNDNEPHRVSDQEIHVVQDQDCVLTPSHIWFSDKDSNYNDLELQYEIKNLSNLFFYYCNESSNPIDRYDQKELQNGDICLQHYGSILGENILSVTDGSFVVLVKLKVNAEPIYLKVAGSKEKNLFSKLSQVLVKGQDWVLIEDKHFAVESNLLQKKNNSNNILFFILSPAITGHLKMEDEIVWHFTMRDLKLNKIKLHINNKSIGHDSIRFLVKIDKYIAIGSLNISSLYDESSLPQIYKQDILFDISRSKSYKVGSEIFSVMHPTARSNEINIAVTTKPLHGILSLFGRDDVSSFKKSDLNNNNLIYTIVSNDARLEKLNDSIAFEISCCSGVILKNVLLFIEYKSQVIDLKSEKLSVLEGGMEIFQTNFFNFNKKHFTALDIFVVIGPHHGHLVAIFEDESLNKFGGNKSNDVVTRFSTFQIENKKVSYVHDGSESGDDHFVVIGKSIIDERISEFLRVEVNVIPVNNKHPIVIHANDLDAEEGAWLLITKEHLYIEDLDTHNDHLVWKVHHISGGLIVVMNDDDDDDVDYAKLQIDDCYHFLWSNSNSFSQSQILSGQVAFIAREKGEHMLILTATDGKFITENVTINIDIKSFNFNRFTFQTLYVFPGILQRVYLKNKFDIRSIDKALMCTSIEHQIKYRLLNLSQYGQILIAKNGADSQIKEFAANFTLTDVINGNLFYLSDFQMPEPIMFTKEEFIVEIFISNYLDPKNEIKEIVATEIIVSAQNIHNDNADQLLSIKNLSLDEGKSAVLTREHLNDVNLVRELNRHGLIHFYEIIEVPKHGWLYKNQNRLTLGSHFKQSDIVEGKMKYEHDDSESLEDRVQIQVSFANKDKMINKLLNDSEMLVKKGFYLKMSISPKDDESFQLETQNPSMDLVQGSYKKITKYHLMTSDPDTPPDKIFYQIINQPSNCVFVLLNDYQKFEQKYSEFHSIDFSLLNNTRLLIYRFGITEFTQSDINNELLLLIHDSKSSNHDAFYFGVSDGTKSQIFKIFHIKIEPLFIKAKRKLSTLNIEQSNILSIITSKELDVETNGDHRFIVYNITTEPNFGLIYKKTIPVNSFTQADIDDRLVSYVQTDFSTTADFFIVSIPSNELMTIKISVVPIDITNPLPSLKPGQELVFTTKWIDSRKLAMQTESDPLYEVIKLPTKGKLKFKGHSKRRIRSNHILRNCNHNAVNATKCSENIISKLRRDDSNNFNFHRSDIFHERISYIADASQLKAGHYNLNYVEDSFEFILSAPRTQQTLGLILIQIESQTSNESHVEVLQKEIKSGDEEITSHVVDNSSNDHISDKLKVIGSIVFVAVIFAIIFIAYKCFKHHKRRKHKFINSSNLETVNSADQKPISPHLIFSKSSPSISSTNKNNAVDSNSFEPNVTNLSDASSHNEINDDVDQQTPAKESPKCLNNDQQISPTNSAKKNRPFDWKKVDPELLQHCRKTTPVLHTNQYWV